MAAVFGREAELAVGEAFVESARERVRVLVFEGESGIGKTTVWGEIAQRAEARGLRVLAARPAEAETKLALSAVADLLEPVAAGSLAGLPAPQRRALEIALLRAEPDEASLDPRPLAAAVRSLLLELAGERPLLVAVDDVQWLDGPSATVLGFALRRIVDRPVGWLLARRLGVPARLVDDPGVADEALTRRRLGPLTLAALHQALRAGLGRQLSRPALARVHQASGGNPLFALEIARILDTASLGDPGTPLPVSEDLRELVDARIATAPIHARAAVLCAAALSHPTAELVERAASPDGLSAAEESGLLRVDASGRVAFAHPLYASAVYAATASRRRRVLHRRLARLVDDPEERARHLAVATTEPDESIACELEHAAALARSRGSWESAADLLERAFSLTPEDRRDVAHGRGVAAAEHHVFAGDRSRGRALLEGILEQPLPEAVRADALRLLGEISSNDENHLDARRLFTEALEHADDPRLMAAIELGLAYVLASLMDWRDAAAHAYRALAHAEAITDLTRIGQALAHCAMMDFLSGKETDWDKVERALALEGGEAPVAMVRQPSTIAALLLLYEGRHTEARFRLRALCAAARERGDESDLAFVLLWLSWLEARSGDLAAAAAAAEEAESLAGLTGSPSTHAWVCTQQAYVHALRGAVDETRRGCAEAAGPVQRSGNLLPGLWIAASLAVLELSLGDPAAAWRACRPLTEALERHGIDEPVPAFFLPDALEALIALGQLDRAEALLNAFETRGRELDRAWALATAGRCRALLLAARGDLAGGRAAIERALAEHDRLDMPFERARTLLAGGAIDRRARQRRRARESLQAALEIFERVGATSWAKRTRDVLDRLGPRRGVNGELTDGERRVAVLAAQGLTNREVATTLFVSPKTVEAHLARVYRKLGITSRAQLGARMARSQT